jgi:hypothetical protein
MSIDNKGKFISNTAYIDLHKLYANHVVTNYYCLQLLSAGSDNKKLDINKMR